MSELLELDTSVLATAATTGKRGRPAGSSQPKMAAMSKEQIESEIAREEQRLRELQMNRRLLSASPELKTMIDNLRALKRQMLEGDKWKTNAGGKVDAEIKRLTDHIAELKSELDQLDARLREISADKGVGYGQAMIDDAATKMDELRKVLEPKLSSEIDSPMTIDDILASVQ